RVNPAVGDRNLPDFEHGDSLEDYLTDIEKQAIMRALEETRWNRTAAAKKLGMSFRSLRYRLKKLGLDTDD
ncbi:MAG TPA: helix-turn-helix domain-containing protein, partial [Candidatus Kapabacteria bacterium]|nr:helix-turn-helix domain-containing protein [Candidatus Kapabacteria bacterium]